MVVIWRRGLCGREGKSVSAKLRLIECGRARNLPTGSKRGVEEDPLSVEVTRYIAVVSTSASSVYRPASQHRCVRSRAAVVGLLNMLGDSMAKRVRQ